MDNCVPGHDVPHPEWVGWSNDKRECLTNEIEKKVETTPTLPVPVAPIPAQEPRVCNCWKRFIIIFLFVIMLILAYFLWKKWKIIS